MNEIKEIYNAVYNNDDYKHPDTFMTLVEPISKKLMGLNCDSENCEKGKRLISDYALNKSNQDYDEKALPYLIKAIELQIDYSETSKLNPIKKELLYRAGIILFEQKKFKNSLKYFKILVMSFPKNSEFVNGYNTCLKKIINPIDYVFLAGLVIFLIIDYVLKINTDFTLYGLIVCLAGTLLINGYYQLKKKS